MRQSDGKGFYHSVVLKAFGIEVDWLWQQLLSKVADVRREVKRTRAQKKVTRNGENRS